MYSSNRRFLYLVGCLMGLCLAYIAGFATYSFWVRPVQIGHSSTEPMAVFWEAWDYVEQLFYGQVPAPRERTYGAIRGALAMLNDPYTVFVEPQPRELERDQLRGSFGGIGVTVERDPEGRLLLSPYPGSPAERAGVCEGDVLLAVDGEPVTDEMTVDDVRVRLRGEPGTAVTLTLARPGPEADTPTLPFDLTITRETIEVPSTVWRMLDQAPDIGYVRIERFTERTDEEVLVALRELRQAEASGLIMDLRDNAGGLIDPAVSIASQFLSGGIVLIERSREAEERTFPVQNGGVATDIPLVVLVNGGTASAAEIVAGALQDHGRAPLIGEITFGKGSVQQIYDLSDGSSLHVTSAIWFTPNRHRITGQGLTPDVYVARGDDLQDVQLDLAIECLHSQSWDAERE